jgi:hypothetical protein
MDYNNRFHDTSSNGICGKGKENVEISGCLKLECCICGNGYRYVEYWIWIVVTIWVTFNL